MNQLSPEAFLLEDAKVQGANKIIAQMKKIGNGDVDTAKSSTISLGNFMAGLRNQNYSYLVEQSTETEDQSTPIIASQIEDQMDLSKSQLPWAKDCDSSMQALGKLKLAMYSDPKSFRSLSSKTNQTFSAIQNVLVYDPVISPLATEYAIIESPDLNILALGGDNIQDLQISTSSQALPSSGNMTTFWGYTIPPIVEDRLPWSPVAESTPLPGIKLEKSSMFNYSVNYKPVGYNIKATMEAMRLPGMLEAWNQNQLQSQIYANRKKYRDIVSLAISGFSADTANFNFGAGVPTNITAAAPITTQASVASGISSYVTTNDLFAANPITAGTFSPLAFCIWLRDKYLQMSTSRLDFYTTFPSIMICNDDVAAQFLTLDLPVTNKTLSPAEYIKAFGVDIEIPDMLGRIKLKMSLTTLNLNKTVVMVSPGLIEEVRIQGMDFSSTSFDPEIRVYSENKIQASMFKPDTQQTRWVYSYAP